MTDIVERLRWIALSNMTALAAITKHGTYTVIWVPDMHVWTYDGRPFERVDMAKAAAQADYDRARAALTQEGE